jgi:hypothetical protein
MEALNKTIPGCDVPAEIGSGGDDFNRSMRFPGEPPEARESRAGIDDR